LPELEYDLWTTLQATISKRTYIADRDVGRYLAAAEKIEAIRWYKRAAAAGNEYAAFGLHRFGEYDEALRWLLHLADDQINWTNSWARQKVAQCYNEGLGVAVDKDEAQRWQDS
jgi:TPR repeat protein